MIIITLTPEIYTEAGKSYTVNLTGATLTEVIDRLDWKMPNAEGVIPDVPMLQGLALKHLQTILPPVQAVAWSIFLGQGLLAYREITGQESFWLDDGDVTLTRLLHRQRMQVQLEPDLARQIRRAKHLATKKQMDIGVVLYTSESGQPARYRLFEASRVSEFAIKDCKYHETPKILGVFHFHGQLWLAWDD